MTSLFPLWFRWDGEAMIPLNPKAADRQFVIGERYNLEHREDRSAASHSHEFAWLQDAWENLPEHLADQFQSPEHLRKRALIAAGYFSEEIIDCSTHAAAMRVAAYAGKQDTFAAVVVRGPIVVVRTAKSQSRRHMNREEFQASKTALMEVIAQMIGVTPDALKLTATLDVREAG